MAEQTVDQAIEICKLKPERSASQTSGLLLYGSHKYSDKLFIRLIQDYGLDVEVSNWFSFEKLDSEIMNKFFVGFLGCQTFNA